jgi:alpha-glucosidase
VVGLPAMQQYFGFGFHQCRWGYENWTVVEGVVQTYEDFGIPLEVIWTDIDYMKSYRDFENDPIRFGYTEGRAFLERLAASGRHYIPIIDSAIYVPNPANASDAYSPFNAGNETGSYLLNPDGSLYIGEVWPGYTVFPDWHTSSAKEWWTNQMVTWHSKIPFSGAWIDMSEVSSFCVGSCGSGNLSLNPVHPDFGLGGEPCNIIYDYPEGFNLTNSTEAASASAASSSQSASCSSSTSTASSTSTSYLRSTPTPGIRNVNHPPYVINHVQGNHDLAEHAVSPNATHHDGILEYDVHNLFGHEILQATYAGLSAISPGSRPFIIGRSTFPGSGVYAGHWGGDNASKWYYMFFAIPQALSFSLFGIPMFGVDTCGFNGNSDEELCNRWMQLSAFFPFYRNHNTLSAISQEAYVWSSVIDATKAAMAIRFQLLPYIYTLFYHAHTRGDTVMRALAWNFPNDPSLAAADRQFFLGDSILVTPVLDQGATSVNGVFPGIMDGSEVYYDWYTQSPVAKPATANSTISAPLGKVSGTLLVTSSLQYLTSARSHTSLYQRWCRARHTAACHDHSRCSPLSLVALSSSRRSWNGKGKVGGCWVLFYVYWAAG